MSHDVRSQAQTFEKETRRMTLKCMSIACSSHGVHMVYSQTMHGHQGGVIYCQHKPCIYCINKIAIYQRLLVEFSYDSHLISIMKIYCLYCYQSCDQWLPQHHMTITMEKKVRLFLHYVWKLYSLFTCVISDRNLQFVILFI